MSVRIDCPACAAPLDVGRRHRGRAIRCPACGGNVTVPHGLDFRGAHQDAVGDRRTGGRALVTAIFGTVVCVGIPVCAAVWWWTSRRITHAVEDGRVPAESLLAARVVAAVGLFAQVLFWASVPFVL